MPPPARLDLSSLRSAGAPRNKKGSLYPARPLGLSPTAGHLSHTQAPHLNLVLLKSLSFWQKPKLMKYQKIDVNRF